MEGIASEIHPKDCRCVSVAGRQRRICLGRVKLRSKSSLYFVFYFLSLSNNLGNLLLARGKPQTTSTDGVLKRWKSRWVGYSCRLRIVLHALAHSVFEFLVRWYRTTGPPPSETVLTFTTQETVMLP